MKGSWDTNYETLLISRIASLHLKNAGMVKALEQKIGKHVNVSPDSEYAGAIGACLLVKRRLKRLEEQNVMVDDSTR
jgi:hypothetical protein